MPTDTSSGASSSRSNPTVGSSIGDFLVRRLQHYGVRHLFGIPGDYVLSLYDKLYHSPITVVGTGKEDGAGFAADAYARCNGIGACCVTYCVGGLSIANAIAGAYAEKSPVVIISGSPGLNERHQDPMLHHKIRDFNSQLAIFSQITELAVVIDNPDTAFNDIDQALATCIHSKRPVYIEVPRDMVDVVPRIRERTGQHIALSDPDCLQEALTEIVGLMHRAERPVILAGVEIHRHRLQSLLRQLIDDTGIPVAVTLLGKSVISELHPRYLGVYEGAMGRDDVREVVENSDCLIMLGTFMTDVNLGIFTADLKRDRCIQIRSDLVQVRHHRYVDLRFEDLIRGLVASDLPMDDSEVNGPDLPALAAPVDSPLTVEQLYNRLNDLLQDDMAVICDVGLCLFGSVDLIMHRRTEFIAPAYYTSMGFGVPAALGVGMARPEWRQVVLVGDGAFQMTGMELSSILQQGQKPIIIVLNNRGYTTERAIMDGPYNDIRNWRFSQLPAVLGDDLLAWEAATEAELVEAWHQAVNSDKAVLIEAHLQAKDYCPALNRLGERLNSRL